MVEFLVNVSAMLQEPRCNMFKAQPSACTLNCKCSVTVDNSLLQSRTSFIMQGHHNILKENN